MVGNVEAIDAAISAIKNNGMVLKVMEGLQDYWSFKIKFSEDKKRACLGQPHLIKIWKRNLSSISRMLGVTKFHVHLNF